MKTSCQFDRKILAIGGAVIKTAREELRKVIEQNKVEMLIHNGGSIFHDFQLTIDNCGGKTSYPLDDLLENYQCNEPASREVLKWVSGYPAPEGSITSLCESKEITILLFTGLACDFWQMFGNQTDWETLATNSYLGFKLLTGRFKQSFHYICMGSAVIHPEVFIKALAKSHQTNFRADVVDFIDMYRPRTRIAKYGEYYKMTHKEFLTKWINKGDLPVK
jgi:hypothetical protein